MECHGNLASVECFECYQCMVVFDRAVPYLLFWHCTVCWSHGFSGWHLAFRGSWTVLVVSPYIPPILFWLFWVLRCFVPACRMPSMSFNGAMRDCRMWSKQSKRHRHGTGTVTAIRARNSGWLSFSYSLPRSQNVEMLLQGRTWNMEPVKVLDSWDLMSKDNHTSNTLCSSVAHWIRWILEKCVSGGPRQ